MAALLQWVIAASVLTAVTDWAAWHFVWRHEFEKGEAVERKHSITSMFFSYILPFMPVLAILLGPDRFGIYDAGFEEVASLILFVVLGILTAGVAMSAWMVRVKHHEEANSRALIDQEDTLPEHALNHLLWTTSLLLICSIIWFTLLTL
ncbi:MAG: hypothetical protein QGI21_06705 [Candidatus Poseidoniaceae archaeon]|jgi:hypothetical protein|nr:hypothetical protein [Candidatus Poseidoniaceae archaeon]